MECRARPKGRETLSIMLLAQSGKSPSHDRFGRAVPLISHARKPSQTLSWFRHLVFVAAGAGQGYHGPMSRNAGVVIPRVVHRKRETETGAQPGYAELLSLGGLNL